MSEDLQVQQRVTDELEFDPGLNAAHIGVFVHDGVVTLTGFVENYVEKQAAERAARRVKGVKAVAQELSVRLPSQKKLADDEIAARAVKLLEWDLRVPQGSVAITVEQGTVKLSGEVAWEFQSREAEADVRKLSGVVHVVNLIRVRPHVQSDDIQKRIRAAFERSADLEANHVVVQVEDEGAIVLSGRVRTLPESATAETAAWSAPGVTSVRNLINVGI